MQQIYELIWKWIFNKHTNKYSFHLFYSSNNWLVMKQQERALNCLKLFKSAKKFYREEHHIRHTGTNASICSPKIFVTKSPLYVFLCWNSYILIHSYSFLIKSRHLWRYAQCLKNYLLLLIKNILRIFNTEMFLMPVEF